MARRTVSPDQAELFTVADVRAEAEAARKAAAGRPPCLYRSAERGMAARTAEYEAWVATYGNFGSLIRSHAWVVAMTAPAVPTELCRPTLLRAGLEGPHRGADPADWPECDCATAIGGHVYRGACTGCQWEGPDRQDQNEGVEDAHDHAWPDWRDLPVLTRWPYERKAQVRWLESATVAYPAGWLEAGGPIRTWREPMGTRHTTVAGAPFGYDLGVLQEPGRLSSSRCGPRSAHQGRAAAPWC
jgi:hypothetical protein